MTDLEYIVSKLSKEEILCQIAEEASELAQAALKLRRAITGLNPTPLSVDAATDDFFEDLPTSRSLKTRISSWFPTTSEVQGNFKAKL